MLEIFIKRISLILIVIAELILGSPTLGMPPTTEIAFIASVSEEIAEPIESQHGVRALPYLLEVIAQCESGNRHFSSDGTILRGQINDLDIGKYQINLFYHKEMAEQLGLDLFKETDNEAYALWLFQHFGTEPWNPSKRCWEKYKNLEKALE